MIISNISIADLKGYCNVTIPDDDSLFTSILTACKAYIKGYTGLSDEEMDLHEDLSIALYVLASELYDNRAFTIEATRVNPNMVVTSILGMYATNYL